MIIEPFEVKEYYFFKKTRAAIDYKKSQFHLFACRKEIQRVEELMSRCRYEPFFMNLHDNLRYLKEIEADIVYFRANGITRPKPSNAKRQYGDFAVYGK